MRKKSLAFLEELLNTPTPSGWEHNGQDIVQSYLKPYVNSIKRDRHGNLVSQIKGSTSRRVMLAGHIDEIYMIVTHIDKDGFAYFAPLGYDVENLVGAVVFVCGEKGDVKGVIGKKAVHLQSAEERKKKSQAKDMWIDLGVKSQKEAEKLICIGDRVVVRPTLVHMPNNRLVSRALDDKIGVFIVCETMRLLAKKSLKVNLFGVSTVQEEQGLRGAQTAVQTVKPDIGIAIDVGWATDHPRGADNLVGHIELGEGPILKRGPEVNRRVFKMLSASAKKAKIPVQVRAGVRAGGTDTAAMQVGREGGVASALLAIPNRYMHTPVEMVSLDDAENAAKLLAYSIEKMSGKENLIP